jgi:hypothetical protein
MVRICQQCRSANPADAVYCYQDGVFLNGNGGGDVPAINVAQRPFAVPFVLPSGRECKNFNQLALACQADPATALNLLRKGHLESFLAAQGRSDLAEAAHAAARAADRGRGLDEFLAKLPADVLRPAQLRVEPAAIDLGTVRPGEDRRCELVLHNDGMRLLYGSASCSDTPWLSLGDGPRLGRKSVELSDRLILPLQILGKALRAYRKPQDAEVRVETSGGTIGVMVRIVVPVQPFPDGVLAGAVSPRQLAEKALQAQAEAAGLVQNGAVARWYEVNGWTYPVAGPTATGQAALQQLFEALGLAKAPRVELSEDAIQLSGRPGEKIEHVLVALSQENRAAVAHAVSNQPWLRVDPTIFRGRSAFLPLTVAAIPGRTGETLTAQLSVTANGNQRFVVPVSLTVGSASRAAPAPRTDRAAVPVAAPAVPPPAKASPAEPARVRRRAGWPVRIALIPAVLLLPVVAGALLHDYLAPDHAPGMIHDEVVDSVPRIELRFHEAKQQDELEKLWLTDPQPTMRFGVMMLRGGQEIGQGVNVRRLTFDPWGRTNNTCLRFDETDERLFGGAQGSWQEREIRTWKDDQGHDHEGVQSIWVCDDKKIRVTQFVELVRGQQSALLDTCRVQYRIVNFDAARERSVGIRFLLDSFIGGNDGVPFTIPGESDLCDTMKDLPSQAKDQKLPDFLQALEKPDLAHPGTIAHLRLKVDGLETPERVTLGAWPNEKLRVLVQKNADGPSTLYDVPVLPMKSLGLDDSAITIYWKQQPLPPGGKRDVGFEYGLWNLASQGSRLAATVDGAFRPEGELTVVAYVNRSVLQNADETVTLTLPEGFQLLAGAATQPVPPLAKDARGANVPITWKLQAGPNTGKFELSVTSGSGLSQTLPVEIKKPIF